MRTRPRIDLPILFKILTTLAEAPSQLFPHILSTKIGDPEDVTLVDVGTVDVDMVRTSSGDQDQAPDFICGGTVRIQQLRM